MNVWVSNNHHEATEVNEVKKLHALHGKKQLTRIINKLFTNNDYIFKYIFCHSEHTEESRFY